jgi:N-acetyl-anhydromuramyl-L-alanine amidase AmpD
MNRHLPAAPDCIRTRDPRYPVDRAILHGMDGTLRGTIAWFQLAGRSPPTATHYLVGRNGDIVQMVPDGRKALHAGSTLERGWNDRSIGVEFEVRIRPWPGRVWFPLNDWPDPMLLSGAKVVAIMARKFGFPLDRVHVIGHSEVPGATHTDPGEGFDWGRFLGMCGDAAGRLS